jgi:hypothetical protein
VTSRVPEMLDLHANHASQLTSSVKTSTPWTLPPPPCRTRAATLSPLSPPRSTKMPKPRASKRVSLQHTIVAGDDES